jgi:hypothetical protein
LNKLVSREIEALALLLDLLNYEVVTQPGFGQPDHVIDRHWLGLVCGW